MFEFLLYKPFQFETLSRVSPSLPLTLLLQVSAGVFTRLKFKTMQRFLQIWHPIICATNK